MKKGALVFLVLCLSCFVPILAIVNGSLTQQGNKYLLHAWGTHYERGYATGYLMAPNIYSIFSTYFYTNVTGSSAGTYSYYQQFYNDNYIIDDRYQQEAAGMIAGMIASGTPIYHAGLQRDLDVNDILFVNGIVDIAGYQDSKNLDLGCASLSSWGLATAGDMSLNGNLVITRMLDWSRHNTLVANPLLVIHHPSEPDEQKWISFTYPGLFGGLSAISAGKSAAFLNMGNIHTNTTSTNLSNVLFDVRSGIERLDYNNDGFHSTEDVFDALSANPHIGGTIIHNVQQWQDSSRAAIIETNNSGTVRRTHNQDSELNGFNLAATNHFRTLYPAEACSRYARIIDSLAVNPFVTSERHLTIMKGAAGVSQNLMMIQYQPDSGSILWSVAAGNSPAYTQAPLYLDTDELFVQPTDVSDEYLPAAAVISLYPNPVSKAQSINVQSPKAFSAVKVYNLKGQLVHQSKTNGIQYKFTLPSDAAGIYFLKLQHSDGTSSLTKFIYLK